MDSVQHPRAILFDVDGVLIRPPHYYSLELENTGYPRAQECLDAFYTSDSHRSCLMGQSDAMAEIAPYLKAMGWPSSAGDYFLRQFRFERQFLDGAMMGIVSQLRRRGMLCCLATDQEKHRARYLLEDMSFKDIFDGLFISCLIGQRKCNPAFWAHVIGKMSAAGVEPSEILFVDDIQTNVEAARRFGIRSLRFETVGGFKTQLGQVGLDLAD